MLKYANLISSFEQGAPKAGQKNSDFFPIILRSLGIGTVF